MSHRAQAEFKRWRYDCIAHSTQPPHEMLQLGDNQPIPAPRGRVQSITERGPNARSSNDGEENFTTPGILRFPNPPRVLPSHIRVNPYSRVAYHSLDPDWLREVSQAFGPQAIDRLQQEQLQALYRQPPSPPPPPPIPPNTIDRSYRQITHEPPIPSPPNINSRTSRQIPGHPQPQTLHVQQRLAVAGAMQRTLQGTRKSDPGRLNL